MSKPETLRALHAEWRKMSPQIQLTVDSRQLKAGEEERLVRLAWTNSALVTRHSSLVTSPITSWNQLTEGQGRFLLKTMREESGSNAAYRATLIARLAVELFGADWNAILRERLVQRFRVASPESLAPRQFWAEVEELVSRIARRDGVEIEVVRQRFFGKAVAAASSPSPREPRLRSQEGQP